jgi:protein TonB
MNLFNFSNNNLDEVVFEQRNKAYGAYAIRKSYPNTLNKSMLIALSPMILILVIGLIWNKQKTGTVFPPQTPIVPTICPPMDEVINIKGGFEFILETPTDLFRIVADKAVQNKPKPKEYIKPIEPTVLASTGLGLPSKGGLGIPNGLPGLAGIPGGLPSGGGAPQIIEFTAEVMPEFPGGKEAMYAYISENLHYPKMALESGVEGKVVITFVVMADGSIQMSNVERGIGYGCDDEALRVVKEMPTWEPGRQNGRKVPVRMVLPVVFQTN